MQIVRVYTGEDGDPHFEMVDPLTSEAWTKGVAVSNCIVREMAPGTVMDWHPAPRRQLVFHLAGRLEIGLRDGTTHVFGPGDVRLMDDVTGSGHLTRVIGDEPVVHAMLWLPAEG
jgi:quercetin dioxygenase-like cupin family protein